MALLAGCGSDDAAAGSAEGTTTISFALSYLPDPYLNGLAYAMQEGLFTEAGIDVELLPFGSTTSDSLVSSGQAQFGYTVDARSALLAQAAGSDFTSLMAVYQHTPYQLAVREDSEIDSPADLAGRTHGSFGSPYEVAAVNQMISSADGQGVADEVVLSTGAYQALAAGRVDSVLAYPGDLYGLEQDGTAVTTWDTTEYGVPDAAATILIGNDDFVAENPDVTEAFVQALQDGYEAAVDDPAAANAALIEQFPGEVDQAVIDYVSDLQASALYPVADGPFGTQSAEMWQANADWMAEKGLLVDENGDPVDQFDVSGHFTNEHLAR
ncbi:MULTISPECIES: ABC transporter substrate-binding protein [unclassified Modestobacter]